MVEEGEALLGAALALARSLRRDLEAMPGLQVVEDERSTIRSSPADDVG
jgi:hypothetical protein